MQPSLRNEMVAPGHVVFTRDPATLSAVVGSSVAVCLWDRSEGWGGMNHFQHAMSPTARTATAIYADAAMLALLRLFKEAGCRSENLEAQIFGGAERMGENEGDAAEAVAVARERLEFHAIPIVSEDVGGALGRKIMFDTSTGEAVVLKTERIRQSDWATQRGSAE